MGAVGSVAYLHLLNRSIDAVGFDAGDLPPEVGTLFERASLRHFSVVGMVESWDMLHGVRRAQQRATDQVSCPGPGLFVIATMASRTECWQAEPMKSDFLCPRETTLFKSLFVLRHAAAHWIAHRA